MATPKKGITFGAFDLFHAGHVLMMEEAKTVCDHLIVCIQSDPSIDRPDKNRPVQSIVERQIQVAACRYVDETIVYDTEAHVLEILHSLDWDVRILGEEYRDRDFTGREESLDRCYFNKRPHAFSSSELRERVVDRAELKAVG
ncbi:MAG: adenylyltransferase/cytidyltransferase family protein [Gammaproteobacteria bacterium]|nr:adenylyltransferase/cytidyltransferase family protein [Gammaproteobacteria bacterium]